VSPAILKVFFVFQVSPQPNLAEGFVGRHVCYRKIFSSSLGGHGISREHTIPCVCVCACVVKGCVVLVVSPIVEGCSCG
jgi:hypothetical protein